MLTGKRVVVTGGTGSLGSTLVRRLFTGELGRPESIVVFSRDEAKQHQMRLDFQHRTTATDEIIYAEWQQILRFQIGDIANEGDVVSVLREADVVFNAAALKQVPTCEYFPAQAVRTNILGPENIVHAIQAHRLPVETVIGISTDKACKPVNVMGMTKALQERVFVQANLICKGTRFVGARYGNVLASRGSVIPLFQEQIRHGGPLTITTPDMTRFLMTLNQAVDTVFAALQEAQAGEFYVPRVSAARIVDVATAIAGDRSISLEYTGIRPGEKVHEILVSEEEASRTVARGQYYVIKPMLPELQSGDAVADEAVIGHEYSSANDLLSPTEVQMLLQQHGFLSVEAASLDRLLSA